MASSNRLLPGEIGIIYHFMSVVAKSLLEDRDLAMVGIVDNLANLHLLKPHEDEDRAITNHLVFAAVGWLTMLYDPAPAPAPGVLEIRRSRASILSKRMNFRSSCTSSSYKQPSFDSFDQPISIFLHKFGHPIPEIATDLSETSELITVSCVCFSVLAKVANFKIEWVNSLSLHLECDSVQRVLKIFRFPSFCLLMYRDVNLLSKLYLDNEHHLHQCGMEENFDLTPLFFREVLLSYRLIFGQDKASWKAFRKMLPKFEEHWDCSDRQSNDWDTMLRVLCCSSYDSPDAKQIFREIEAPDDVSPYYYPDSDFPFLGRRILNIQALVSGRNPQYALTALWHDKRNANLWWTFWAVIFIGGGTIILGILQTAFQIWGSISAQKQLDSSNPSPASPVSY